MKQTRIVGFNPSAIKKQMFDLATEEQTKRLIEYAKKEVKKVGDRILTYNSKNHLDRTGNLLNSLCWCVTYNGEKKDSGFYRDEILRNKARGSKGSSSNSFLHEFFDRIDNPELVQGRKMAEEYLKQLKGKSGKWEVYLAILAPYWGYWESGFNLKIRRRNLQGHEDSAQTSTIRLQFQVLTYFWQDVKMDLKPADVKLSVYVPKYSYRNPKYKKKVGYKKIGLLQ